MEDDSTNPFFCDLLCATGLSPDSDTTPTRCNRNDAAQAISLIFDEEGASTWTYLDSNILNNPTNVTATAGMFDGFDYSDPFTTDDRGIWFDGRYDVVALLGLKVHIKFGLNIWARAHGSGTLFSVSEIGETLVASRRT